MKALLLLLVVLAGAMLWRSRRVSTHSKKSQQKTTEPLDMVRCRQCGTHIPDNEALTGKLGPYCCQEHLRLSEP